MEVLAAAFRGALRTPSRTLMIVAGMPCSTYRLHKPNGEPLRTPRPRKPVEWAQQVDAILSLPSFASSVK
jgi:hypothetical protein